MRVLIAVLLLVSLSGCLQFLTGEIEDPQPAPDFAITDTDGHPLNLTDHRGQVVLIDFMGTWCTPCQRAVPVIQDMRAAYPDLVVISMSSTDSEAKVQDFRAQHQADWPHAVVDSGLVRDYLEAGSRADSMMWPSYAIIDQDGDLRFYNRGETLPATFTAALDRVTERQGPEVRSDAVPLALLAFALGAAAWFSPYMLHHTLERTRPTASPFIGLAVFSVAGVLAAFYSRPLSGRVATIAPFLVAAAGLALLVWRVKGTEAIQATGKRIDSEAPWTHTPAYWGNHLWYLLPVWGAVLHAAMLRTALMESLLLPVALAAGVGTMEALSRLPRVHARLLAMGEKAGRIGGVALIVAALWNGLIYIR